MLSLAITVAIGGVASAGHNTLLLSCSVHSVGRDVLSAAVKACIVDIGHLKIKR